MRYLCSIPRRGSLLLIFVLGCILCAELEALGAEWGADDYVAIGATTVSVNGGVPYQRKAPGGNAGTIDLRTGVDVDVGNGSDGDPAGSITLDGSSKPLVKNYRQVAPAQPLGAPPLILTIRGEVEIHCQYLFAPKKIIAQYQQGSPPPRLRVYAGPSLWVSPWKCPGTFVGYCDVVPLAHGTMGGPMEVMLTPQTVTDSSGPTHFLAEEDGTAMNGGCVTIWTKQHGRISVSSASANGGAGDLGEAGGAGGDIRLLAHNSVLQVVASASGGPGGPGIANFSNVKTAGGTGGNAGAVASGPSTGLLVGRFNADGGRGGEGAPGSGSSASGLDGGTGGQGGYVEATTKGFINGAFTLTANGGPGGFAGTATGSGQGGRGGDGGSSGYVLEYRSGGSGTVQYNGGAGTIGGLGGSSAGNGGPGGNGGDAGGVAAQVGGAGQGGPSGTGGSVGTPGQPGRLYPSSLVGPKPHPVASDAEWTILVFIAGDIEGPGYFQHYAQLLLNAVNEMEQVNLWPVPVHLLVFWDRNAFPDNASFLDGQIHASVPSDVPWGTWSNSRFGYVMYSPDEWFDGYFSTPKFGSALLPLQSGASEMHTDDASTWVEFVRRAAKLAPAQHYGLVYLGHGAGYRGLAQDLTDYRNATDGWMSMAGLKQAAMGMAANVPTHKLDVLAALGCQLSTIEVATELSGTVDYFVGSQTGVSGTQYGFKGWLEYLRDNDVPEGGDMAGAIFDFCSLSDRSLLILDQMPALNAALLQFSRRVQIAVPSDLGKVHESIPATSPFEYLREFDKDLGKFLENLSAESFTDPAINQAVSLASSAYAQVVWDHRGRGSGLSVYLPRCEHAVDSEFNDSVTFASSDIINPLRAEWRRMLLQVHTRTLTCSHSVFFEEADLPDTTDLAQPLGPLSLSRTYVSGRLGFPADKDMISFNVLAGQTLSLDFAATSVGSAGPLLSLYAPDKTTLLAQGTSASLSGGRLALPESGTYYLLIAAAPGQTNAQNYELSLIAGDAEQMRPDLVVSATSLDFGLVTSVDVVYRTLLLSNAGQAELTLTNLITDSPLFDAELRSGVLPIPIPPGATAEVRVWFTPLTNGVASGTLELLVREQAAASEVSLQAEVSLQPALVSPRFDASTGFSAVLLGQAGKLHAAEFSTNATDWIPLRNILTNFTAAPFRDSGATNEASRVYRVKAQ